MKILYDYQVFGWQRFGGISRYFVELMSRLPSGISFSNSIVFSNNIYLRQADERFSKGLSFPDFKASERMSDLINKLNSKSAIRKGKYDILHPTFYNPYILSELKTPYVVTVYDMIHEKFRDMFHKYDRTCENKKKVICAADKIIAISHNTKKDIVDIYGIPEDRIEVVHLGHSVNNNYVSPIENLPNDFILFVGQRWLYKNFERTVKAFLSIVKEFPEIKLVCTGSPFTSEEQQFIHSLKLDKNIAHYFVSDSQLTYLYQHAICFIYPSLYEGFGIPILESFAAKCPLALSNTSCFPEIAKDGGYYFDPYDEGSIAKSLRDIIVDGDLRKTLISKGTETLSHYSWDKMALETAKIYQTLI